MDFWRPATITISAYTRQTGQEACPTNYRIWTIKAQMVAFKGKWRGK
jgi:hypothetical protein